MIATLAFVALLAAPSKVTPQLPTVGDPIRIDVPAAKGATIAVEKSADYEVVRVEDGLIVIRSFKPGEFTLHATARDGAVVRRIDVPVRVVSVLHDQSERPSPLKPPLPPPPNAFATRAIVSAAIAAALIWLAVVLLSRRVPHAKKIPVVPPLAPGEEFRRGLAAAQKMPLGEKRLIELTSGVRRYLARTVPQLGLELTSQEMLDHAGIAGFDATLWQHLHDVLYATDLAKFSPWGYRHSDFENLEAKALAIVGAIERIREVAA